MNTLTLELDGENTENIISIFMCLAHELGYCISWWPMPPMLRQFWMWCGKWRMESLFTMKQFWHRFWQGMCAGHICYQALSFQAAQSKVKN